MIWLGAILAIVVASYFLSEWWRRPVGDTLRARAPGQFAELSQGVTHYRWDGPVRGPVAVCIHGLTTSSYVWDGIVKVLTMMGFRVLRYDLYGRGYSDRPEGPQDRNFFLRQLRDLLRDQNLGGDLTLVGYSMGGSIASSFAADEPHRMDRLILLATAGLGRTPGPMSEFCRRVPILGDWVMRVLGGWQLRRAVARGPQKSAVAGIVAKQMDETRIRGYLAAVLSSQRYMLQQDMSAEHRRISGTSLPVLAIWGAQDEAIPISAVGQLAKLNREARQVTLEGATHALPHTHVDQIQRAMQDFMRDL